MKKLLLVIFVVVGWTSFLSARGANFSGGTVMLDNVTGDAGAAINTAFATYSVVEVTAPNPTATTRVKIPKGGTLRIRGRGIFTNVGVLFTDSTTDYTGTGGLECPEGATVKLANSVNTALLSQVNFGSLTTTTNKYGLSGVTIFGCIFDGNKSNNRRGWGIQVYGRGLKIENVTVQNTAQGCYWLENHGPGTFVVPGDDTAQSLAHFKGINCGGDGVYFPKGEGWTLTDGVAWGAEGWGLHTKESISVQGFNTYLNARGGCFVDGYGAIQGTDANCTNASGWGLLIGSQAGASQIASATFACSGCIGLEIDSPEQSISGTVANSAIGVKFNGGGGNFSFTTFANTSVFHCTSMNGASNIDVYALDSSQTLFDATTCGSATAPTYNGSQWRWGVPGNIGAQSASTITVGGYRLTFPRANGTLAVAEGTSDERLKTDIKPYPRGLETIISLHPSLYRWNEEGQKITGFPATLEQAGFIAQDVQRAIPEAVATEQHDGVDYLNLNSRPIVAALVNAVQEQQREIEELKAEVKALKVAQ
jgi:hypothetical protein